MSDQSNIQPPALAGAVGDELAPGTALCGGQYTIEKYLNCGGFGITYLARDSLGRKLVIKECFPNAICWRTDATVRLRSHSYQTDFSQAVDLFKKEARALAALDHPNIVGVHQIFEANGTAYMALDFVEGLDLLDLSHRHPELRSPAAVSELAGILLEALAYVHRSGILHRDISPDNILLDTSGTPVLIDFGAARQGATMASRILSRVYTVKDGYSPQEFYFAGSAQSAASDLYALAATLVHLIDGNPPPNSSLRLAAVAEGRPDPYLPLSGRFAAHDPALLASIDRCMSLFSRDRLPTADAWLDVLRGKAALEGRGPGAARTMHIAPAVLDTQTTAAIAALVKENHKVVAQAGAATAIVRCEDAAERAREEARREEERDYWAILNEDPAHWRDSSAKSTTARGAVADNDAPDRRHRLSLAALFGWMRPRARIDKII
ncbi:serine/threonine protein kinase [Salipiger aestuarii]|uniref:serine/threonine-protein kinase n=1 Tax=Salipiger aestuarii TaxID=568098 RepID=UPI00123AF6D8|nr:serine/threonine-protein kinase [Salipiger aestuarii]KAA8605545.1 serine/threonine protein kinase [Salipiger aestuarii]KAA8608254.1 serine/threonine protein kinase [Salipiger aestuarii]